MPNKDKMNGLVLQPGCGTDLGTMNVLSARKSSDGIVTKRIRDVFLDFPITAKKMLKIYERVIEEHKRKKTEKK